MSPTSPPKTSSLSARLQADQQEIQRQLADQSQQLLTQHAASLKKLSFDALRSTRRALERHCSEVDALHHQTLTRMRWLLLWPVAATVLLSLLIVLVVAGWTSYQLDQIGQAQAAVDRTTEALVAQQQAAKQVPQIDQLQPRKRR